MGGQFVLAQSGQSVSHGSPGGGSLDKGMRLPRKGSNYKFFSRFSYYILNRAHVNSRLHKTVISSYKKLEKKYPTYHFKVMECSKKKGGKMFPHRTHQNGLSVDFMTPLTKKNKQRRFYDRIGLFRYLVNFTDEGKLKLNKKVEINFEIMAYHILMLDKEGRKNGIRIKKVILKTDLKDEVFDTKYGRELKRRGIYFVKSLPKYLNNLHDDHYHIDFERI